MDMNDDCHLSLSIAEIEGIDVPAGFQPLGDLDAFIDPEPAGYAIVHVQLGDDRELSAGRLAHGPGDAAGQACPVRQAPAELVRAPGGALG